METGRERRLWNKSSDSRSRSTVRLQNRSPRHRELQYSLVFVIYIDKVVQYIYVSDTEAIEACIRFLDDDDDDDDRGNRCIKIKPQRLV